MPKVRIKKVPTDLDRGTNMFTNHIITSPHDSGWNDDNIYTVNNTLSAVPRGESNLEAEKGEHVITNLNRDGIPENYRVGGKKHYEGGTPLSLPDQSFIFSDDKRKMGIKDPNILRDFGIENEKSKNVYTPADIAKKYDLNTYKKILLDPMSTKMQVNTAEKMISNYNIKLGKLALVQESLKGFPEGVPSIAMPYVATSNMDPSMFEGQASQRKMKYGGTHRLSRYQMGGTTDASWSSNYYSKLQEAYEDHLQSFGLTHDDLTFEDYSQNLDMYDSDVSKEARAYADRQVKRNVDFTKNFQVPGGATYSSQQPQNRVPSTSSKTTKSWNIPKDATQIDDSQEGWQDKAREAIGQGKQVYIKSGDGYKRVTGLKAPEGQYNPNDPKYKAMGQYAGEYSAMTQMVNSNPELQDALYNKYKEEQKSSSNKTGPLLSKEQMLSNFFDFQSQVYSIRNLPTADQIDPRWDNGDNKMYHEVSDKLGLKPLDPHMIANAQATYAGLVNLSKDPKFNSVFSNYDVVPVGLGDEKFMGREDISPIDSDFGNTTQGQWFRPKSTDLSLEDIQQQETKVNEPIKPGVPNYESSNAQSDWWLQDIVKTAGAFGDTNKIKKYLPWDRPINAVVPDVTFYDPSRALAANSEQASIADQTLSSFAGAQGTSARVSQVQGQALANAANVLGDYENKNVAVANQYDNTVASIRNQVGAANREIQKGLYDATTISNQQFDNSKALARQGLRQSYIDAITNRAQTQALNTLYPQYNVDPSSGGFVNFTKGRQLHPGASTSQHQGYQVDMNYLKKVQELKNQGYDETTIRQAMSTGNSQLDQMDDKEREAFLAQLGISTPPYAQ